MPETSKRSALPQLKAAVAAVPESQVLEGRRILHLDVVGGYPTECYADRAGAWTPVATEVRLVGFPGRVIERSQRSPPLHPLS